MAITFPAAPTTGQVYTDTTSGQSWTWDGVKWKGASSTAYWKRTGTAVEPYTAGDTIQGQLVPTNGALGSRNVIINGMVNINQRGVTIAAAAVGAYGPDRWKKVDASHMTQIIEDLNFVHGAKYTLSWKGGTPQVLTAPGSGHWTLPNIPITATEIQLELGEVATPFERRPYGLELALCQRYFEFISAGNLAGVANSTNEARMAGIFRVFKRATPTIAIATGTTVVIKRILANATATASSASITDSFVSADGISYSHINGFTGLSSGEFITLNGTHLSATAEL